MRLTRLRLRNYRNYVNQELSLEPGLNVYLGQNAQGKTNLLEAVALLALSSSPRARRDAELIGPAATEALAEGFVERDRRPGVEVAIRVAAGGERSIKTIRVDGAPRRAVDLPGAVNVALFWPEDLGLVKGAPAERRRFLNELLVQIVPGYAARLSEYRRLLEQRNGLLRRIAAGLEAPASLQIWEEPLAVAGAAIADARRQAVGELAPLASAHHASVSGGEQLEVTYQGPPEDLEAALARARDEDLRRGTTSLGPHRDDLLLAIDGADARSFASQGQQRTAVVALKLAEADLMEKRGGERPVTLLDDVLSELDAGRRDGLLSSLADRGQVIVTAVDADVFPAGLISGAAVRCIAAGQVSECG